MYIYNSVSGYYVGLFFQASERICPKSFVISPIFMRKKTKNRFTESPHLYLFDKIFNKLL